MEDKELELTSYPDIKLVELNKKFEEINKKVEEINEEKKRLQNQIQLLEKYEKRKKENRDYFPFGFHFRYNNRRGDPNYTAYWECYLLNKRGKEVWRNLYYETHYNADQAKSEALETAWKIVDISTAINELKEEENE